jgi:hypothetical protein
MNPVEIIQLIEILREKLNAFALDKPLSAPEVVQLSQSLDVLLNLYNKMLIY